MVSPAIRNTTSRKVGLTAPKNYRDEVNTVTHDDFGQPPSKLATPRAKSGPIHGQELRRTPPGPHSSCSAVTASNLGSRSDTNPAKLNGLVLGNKIHPIKSPTSAKRKEFSRNRPFGAQSNDFGLKKTTVHKLTMLDCRPQLNSRNP